MARGRPRKPPAPGGPTLEELQAELARIDKAIDGEADTELVAGLKRQRGIVARKLQNLRAQAKLRPDLTVVPPPEDGPGFAPPDFYEADPVDRNDGTKRTFEWTPGDYEKITDDVVGELLTRKVDVFCRADQIVEIRQSSASIVQLDAVRMREVISSHCRFIHKEDGAYNRIMVPEVVARTICSRPDPGFRPLVSVIRAPTLRAQDGSILEAPGYDPSTCLFYQPDATKYRSMTANPTLEQAAAARSFLLQPIVDFPFILPAHREVAIAYLMTCVLRSAINDPTPGFGFDAPDPGTGKSLLVRMGGWIAMGREPHAEGYLKLEEEQEKRIVASLQAGRSIFMWDNIDAPFGSAIIDMILTSRMFTGRILGTSTMAELVNNCVWCFNGNNLRLKNIDSARRLVWVRMKDPKGNPTARTGFALGGPPELRKWVLEHREMLVRACITIARWGVLNPTATEGLRPYASFEAWSDLIRRPLWYLSNGVDLLDGMPNDPGLHEESANIAAFFAEWLAIRDREADPMVAHQPVSLAELLDDKKGTRDRHDLATLARELAPGSDHQLNRRLGIVLNRWRQRSVLVVGPSGDSCGSWSLISGGKSNKGIVYDLQRVE